MSGGHFEYQESYIGYIAECLERDVRAFSGSATDDDRFSDECLEWYKEHGLTDRQLQALQVLAEELFGGAAGGAAIRSRHVRGHGTQGRLAGRRGVRSASA